MNTADVVRQGEQALAGLLVDDTILTGDPDRCGTELGKRALALYHLFELDPTAVTLASVEQVVSQPGSQIGTPDRYLAHVYHTGALLRDLVRKLQQRHSALDLPHPDEAFAMGLVHDLNATFSDYARGGQQSKELDEYILAEMHGWRAMAGRVALHSVYIEGARLIARGAHFPQSEAYRGMREVLNTEGPLSIRSIDSRFALFLEGRCNLPLLLLTVADYMENGKTMVDLATLEADFAARSRDIVFRYHTDAVNKGKAPSLLGQALVDEKGLERVASYVQIVQGLLSGDAAYAPTLRTSTMFFRGGS